MDFPDKVLRYIREQGQMRAGDRVGVAVSGGADSVALLRVLLALKSELGIVLSVVHFNHLIRGTEARADEEFAGTLALKYNLQFFCSQADVPQESESKGISLEAAGRELRYGYFRSLLESGEVDKVATAHTADDQAETVLMRVIRGAGTKGLAGIHPVRHEERDFNTKDTKAGTKEHKGRAIVRPLLGMRRREVEQYLRELKQDWREDATNRDQKLLRNRVRHTLLPLLEREFNPGVAEVLADVAEIARAEEEYWSWLAKEWMEDTASHAPAGQLPKAVLESVREWPLAMERRILREVGRQVGVHLDFREVEKIRKLAAGDAGRELELGEGWVARLGTDGLRLERRNPAPAGDFEYSLPVPGEVRVPELGTVVKAFLVANRENAPGYNRAQALDPKKLAPPLTVRNWRAGDRFWPAHTRSEKKVKELLQEKRVPDGQRSRWPVAVSGGKIVWVRGMAAGREFAAGPESREMVVIEEVAAAQDNP
jgi:tRNA(Ile)-lysidine synthase